MIAVYRRKSFVLALTGILLFLVAISLCSLSDHFAVLASHRVEAVYLICLCAGILLVIVGVCYYSAAKGYSAAWGGVLLFATCLGWVILLFLPDRTKGDSEALPPEIPFPRQLARAGVMAPLLVLMMSFFCLPSLRGNRIAAGVLGGTLSLLLLSGFICSISALVTSRRSPAEKILGYAIAGTAINAFLVAGMILSLSMMTFLKHHGTLTRALTTDFPDRRSSHTCRKYGARISYYTDWNMEETLAGVYRAPVIELSGPNGSAVAIAFFPSNYPEPLESYAQRIAQDEKDSLERITHNSVDAKLQPVVAQVGGIGRSGYSCRLAGHTPNRPILVNSSFFVVSDATHRIMISTQAQDDAGGTVDSEIGFILDSIRGTGTAPTAPTGPAPTATNGLKIATTPSVKMILYQPHDARALIGNKTVMNGDTIEGFRIVDIEKDSITVQSPAGTKKVLYLGDRLK